MKYISLGRMVIFISLFFFLPTAVWAKSYTYESIDVDIAIHEDATFTVREEQTFQFSGEFHKGYRKIILKDIDALRDIAVYDERGTRLVYDANLSQEYQPGLEGRYNFEKSFNNVQIWWFYDAEDESKTWIIEYTVIGGISFFDDKDELYWNVFTDYDVLVQSSNVIMTLPDMWDQSPLEISQGDLQVREYLSGGESSSSEIRDERIAVASAIHLQPRADFTVAFGFPRGIINRDAYWKDFFALYWGYFAGALVWVISIIFCILYWYFGEKYKKGRGTIIAEYESPNNLPPAMGEAIVKEKISRKTWAATLVDLAVRGFVRIEEEPMTKQSKYLVFIPIVIASIVFGQVIFSFLSSKMPPFALLGIFIFIPIVLITKKGLAMKEYKISLVKDGEEGSLRPFERAFLAILFSRKYPVFSTKEIKQIGSARRRQEMGKKFQELQKDFYEEVNQLGFHNHSFQKESYGKIMLVFLFVGIVWFSFFVALLGSLYFFVASLFGGFVLIFYFLSFEVKLTDQGHEEREKWLGFKEFLYRVERYRVQDLTPDTFERFLPYAMVFGIEKQWAKHFEGIVVDNPDWYSSSKSTVSGGSSFSSSSSVASFSAGAFSASLSSSFASAFSSSSGGGASGGGGSAGGGGGGGGGGAS